MRNSLLIIGSLICSAQAFAEIEPPSDKTFSMGGRVYTDHYYYTSASTLAQSSTSFWLDLESKSEKGVSARFVGELNVFAKSVENPNRLSLFSQIREAYLSYFGDGFDLRLGQQIIPWGKSDGINPTDYFTAKNYSVLNPDDEVKRVGAPSLNISFTPEAGVSPFTFQFIFQAYYPQTKLLIPTSVIPSGLRVETVPRAPSAFSKQAMEYGGKISFQKSDYDFSISAFRGYSSVPQFVFNRGSNTVESVNFAENAFGADASFSARDYVVRFESAFHFPENGGDRDPLYGFVEPVHWDSVVGVERPFLNDFRIQFQFLYRYHLYYRDSVVVSSGNPVLDQIMAGVAKANSTLLNYQRRGNPGSSLRLSFSPENSHWSTDVFMVGYFAEGQDYLLRPEVGYTPIDNLKFLMGLDLYGGDSTRPLGVLHERSDLFVEGKYIF